MNFIKESFSYKVTLLGGNELLVEGHKGLSYYTEKEIVIRIKGKKFFVKGESLYVKEINEDELLVCGRILSFGVVE